MGLGSSAGRVVGFIARIFTALFGRWEPPSWLRFIGRKLGAAGSWGRAHPGRALGGLAVLAALGGGLGWGVRWYQHRPKPDEVDVAVVAPTFNSPEAKLPPTPVTINFDKSVAPLALVGKPVTAGVELSPRVDGAWKWASDKQLQFAPRNDWAIGQDFKIALAKKGLVANNAILSSYALEFSTPPFTAQIAESEYYQDPVDANLKKAVATVEFSHPVDAPAFEKKIHLHLDPKNPGDDEAQPRDYGFHVTYDRYKMKAFIHSEPVEIPPKDAVITITVDKGLKAARGSPLTAEALVEKLSIPGMFNYLTISSARLSLVDNARNEPEQVVVIESSAGVNDKEMQANVAVWLLPVHAPDDKPGDKYAHRWSDPDQVGQPILQKSEKVALEAIPGERDYSTLHSYRVKADPGRYLYILVNKGLKCFGGYVLAKPFAATARVPEFPEELKILQSGAIVSLSGEKKVPLFARDVAAVKATIGRVLPGQIQHLVSQNHGSFAEPELRSYSGLTQDSITESFTEIIDVPPTPHGKPVYPAVDLGKYLQNGGDMRRGLFFLNVQSYDPVERLVRGKHDSRFILVTDLGLLVKDAADGTHDVFVQSLHDGLPVSGAKVDVLGLNGVSVASVTTDNDGHARVASFRDLHHEKQPTLYQVKKGADLSFLPIGRGDRYLDFSRFDVSGISDSGRPQGLSAFLFSDRGIYRPGDEIRVGLVVKSSDWLQKLAGVPLSVEITDARGLVVKKETIKLGAAGFEEIRHTTLETSPTGTWTVNVYVFKDGRPAGLLGSTTVRVREFQPDRMKIDVKLSADNPEGWISPKALKGRVILQNLFGTPAESRRVRASIHLDPAYLSFAKFRDYQFFDPLRAKEGVTDDLADGQTDQKGEAEFDFNLQRFAAATWRLTFLAEGFEAEGGRGVAGETSAIVSPLSYLIGYKAEDDLHYLSRGSKHEVSLIAINNKGAKTSVGELRQVLMERKFVSVLARQDNGTYRYQSVRKEVQVSGKALSIAEGGTKVTLPTDQPGDFTLVIRNGKEEDLQKVDFSVAGQGNLTRSMEKNAELQLTLKTRDAVPGEDLEMQIKAPYAGNGLITIERDRVYSWKWFKSDTSATVQTIKIPADMEGNGYVSVSFIRDINSEDVFSSPLSYGVAPFSISRARRRAKIEIQSPDLAKPGEPYRMKYKMDRPGKIVIFAVDEGILRVADYKTPDPLGYFFQKRALDVRTAQILDLILPEFQRLIQAAAPGGDDEGALGANLNPFKRKRDKPVAFWSGVIDAGPDEREVTYDVPEYFNGTLRVMAVAVAPDSVGVFDRKVHIRGDFVISPNVPTFVAPGDEFEVTVGVSNNIVGSGAKPDVAVELKTSKHLTVVGESRVTLKIPELHESVARFTVRANDILGSGNFTFTTSLNGKNGHYSTDLSVRPAGAYYTRLTAGHHRDGDAEVPLTRAMYPEFRTLRASTSYLPLAMAHGLVGYLEKFPHGCTEQIVSQAIPAVALGGRAEFGFTGDTARASVQKTIDILRTRQNGEGGFGLWTSSANTAEFPTVYAIVFLLEARDRGFAIPQEMLDAGQRYLQSLAGSDGNDLDQERLRAYAIYALTRAGIVTTRFVSNLQKRLEANYPSQWKQDLAAVYVAAIYKLLKQDKLARSLINEAKFGANGNPVFGYYYDPLVYDSQLLYVLARHFPEQASRVTAMDLKHMLEPVLAGNYNTLNSAYTILGLDVYGQVAGNPATGGKLGITELLAAGGKQAMTLPEGLLPRIDVGEGVKALRFSASSAFDAFYMVNESGFDHTLPKVELKQKLEVYREYTDDKGKPLAVADRGDEVQVHVKLRSLAKGDIANIAIVDLLPGGFEVVVQPVSTGGGDNIVNEDHDRGEGDDGEGGGEGDGDRERAEPDDGEGDGEPTHEADSPPPSLVDTSPKVGDHAGPTMALPIQLDGSTFLPEYGDVREDRVVLYGTATTGMQEFIYVIRATSAGKFVVPPIMADSLYDRSVVAHGVAGEFKVNKK